MLAKKKFGLSCLALSAVITLTACHPQVEPVSKMDNELSCSALCAEIQNVRNVKTKIAKSRGFSGRNVGLALIFWPGIVINEVTGDSAETEANTRLAALQNIYVEKKCNCLIKESEKG